MIPNYTPETLYKQHMRVFIPSLSGSGEKIFQCHVTGENYFTELHYHSVPLPLVTADRVRALSSPILVFIKTNL